MFQPHHARRRRGVILLVVITLLMLFAVVGLAFVLYAQAAATAARLSREAEALSRADVDANVLLSFFLGHLIYDVPDDASGVYCALRGHSLGRSMYSCDSGGGANLTPFQGAGRPRVSSPFGAGVEDHLLINYTCYRDDPQLPAGQRFLRDPERLGWRAADPQAARGAYAASFHVPYSYPDLNSTFLAAVRADGTVLLPSFHRPWTADVPSAGLPPGAGEFFDRDTGKINPLWSDKPTGLPPWYKYTTLRPLPAVNPGFPSPADGGGDVKNLIGGPGTFRRINNGTVEHWTNDSFWMDLDFPVLTTPHGRKYKPLFAALVTDLDNRVNANVHGNLNGPDQTHASSQGWGPWEVNLGRVLSGGDGKEWRNLLGSRRNFAVSNLEQLLRFGDTGSQALTSELTRLCPENFLDARLRRLVTTHSHDLVRPGVPPWLDDPARSPYEVTATVEPHRPAVPEGPPVSFQPPAAGRQPSAEQRLGRINLSQPLPPYPHLGSGKAPPFGPPLTVVAGRVTLDMPFTIDAPTGPIWKQFVLAQSARQRLANALYRRLLAITGVPPVRLDQNPQAPAAEQLRTRRWLAQLAVNLVDLIDGDDISTPFLFYSADDYEHLLGRPPFPPGPGRVDPKRQGDGPMGRVQWPLYWVFGTERPRVVVNEAMAQVRRNDPDEAYEDQVRVFVELHQPQGGVPVALRMAAGPIAYAPYQVMIGASSPTLWGLNGAGILPGPHNDNVLGNPELAVIRAATTDADFLAPIAPQGYLLLGPPPVPPAPMPPPDAFLAADPYETANGGPIPRGTPVARTPSLQFPRAFTIRQSLLEPPDERTTGLTVVLRRLANPYLPFDGNRNGAGLDANFAYNPFLTIDYVENIPLQAVESAGLPQIVSRGKLQPYAAHTSQLAAQTIGPWPELRHSFGLANVPAPASYDPLTHLDRPPASPLELLHVSGYQPYQLTQRFLSPDLNGQLIRFGHRAPWLEEGQTPGLPNRRLYRLFDFLESGLLPAGGQVPGKVNINTIWDQETLLALCDPQAANSFDPATVAALLRQLCDGDGTANADELRRTKGVQPGGDDRPLWGFGVGAYPSGDRQLPSGGGLQDTLLRLQPGALDSDLLMKICNQVTTRSNVFAVWLTVGFFEVTDDSTRPVKLGAEVGRAEGRQVRHRMFAVLDRTNLSIASNVSTLLRAVSGTGGFGAAVPQTVPLSAVSGTTTLPLTGPAISWKLDVGSTLVVGVGAEQETVQVLAMDASAKPPTITAAFSKRHAAGTYLALANTPGAPPIFLKPVAVSGPDPQPLPPYVPQPPYSLTVTIGVDPARSDKGSLAGTYAGIPWTIRPGTPILLDDGPDQEVVTVQTASFVVDAAASTGSFQVRVTRPHAGDFLITNTLLGNPGPQPTFDPRDPRHGGLVRYLSIIQ